MNKIHWVKGFSVGEDSMDRQHQQIIKMINSLIDSVDEHTTIAVLPTTLSEMINYALSHFQDEERLMADMDYPQRKEHAALHREFKEKVVKFCAANNANRPGLAKELTDYLRSWLVDHILIEDMKYADFKQSQGGTLQS